MAPPRYPLNIDEPPLLPEDPTSFPVLLSFYFLAEDEELSVRSYLS